MLHVGVLCSFSVILHGGFSLRSNTCFILGILLKAAMQIYSNRVGLGSKYFHFGLYLEASGMYCPLLSDGIIFYSLTFVVVLENESW